MQEKTEDSEEKLKLWRAYREAVRTERGCKITCLKCYDKTCPIVPKTPTYWDDP